ncbi:ATP-binding protein [Candidatus Eisenbacteria bacterium]|uniref:histidine kinase n=1 Tax=Eiseniibacteriota bacterium TaxID=2212470 RepID=A0ABV6YL17_UNCEI
MRVRVEDSGKGISREDLSRIFDPFFTTRSEGTGLGLSVSQSIIQEHGGYISVQSVHGKGTVFEVDLPVERRQGERRR